MEFEKIIKSIINVDESFTYVLARILERRYDFSDSSGALRSYINNLRNEYYQQKYGNKPKYPTTTTVSNSSNNNGGTTNSSGRYFDNQLTQAQAASVCEQILMESYVRPENNKDKVLILSAFWQS